jgi:uncharacterized DUF497 family protein
MTTDSSKAPWGDSPEVDWDDENEGHVAAHGVSAQEVEEIVFLCEYGWWRHPKSKKSTKFANRYLIRGKTLGGKKLMIVVDRLSETKIRPVTALKEE